MEHELFRTIKDYLIKLEFTVKAEVNDIDIVAMKDDVILLIEMKTSLNIPLIAQGITRKKISNSVYLAVPTPSNKVRKSKLFKDKCLVVKHLGLGLLLVDTKKHTCEPVFDPSEQKIRTSKKKKQSLLKEFTLRKTTVNIGGVSRTKIITAYKELALMALYYLQDGKKTTKQLRALTNRNKVVDILQKNYYGWFERVSRGVYQLTSIGEEALLNYQDVIEQLTNEDHT